LGRKFPQKKEGNSFGFVPLSGAKRRLNLAKERGFVEAKEGVKEETVLREKGPVVPLKDLFLDRREGNENP